MAIFSRRMIQRLMNENASFINNEQSENHRNKLNEGDISFEWEVVLLNVFSKIGKVTHEPIFENSSRKIDILFSSNHFNRKNEVEFLADVATVSDYSAEQENPVQYLDDKLSHIQLKNNLPGGFGFAISGNTALHTYQTKKQKLFIPTKTYFDKEVFNKDFKSFVNKIINNPHLSRDFHINRDGINLMITYSLGRTTHSITPTYKEIITLEKNTIWKALIRKYKQLKETNYQGHLGIILCDGDCESIKEIFTSWYGKTSGDVIHHFLRKKLRVSFVLTLWVKEEYSYGAKNKVVAEIYKGQNCDEKLEDFLSYFRKNLDTLFPVPERSVSNAINFMKTAQRCEGESFYGGYIMSKEEIKISSRVMLDLLAGKITYDDFPEEYKYFFQKKLAEGKLIEGVNIEKEWEKDDDWLNFNFGESDPAISSYKEPKSHNND